jgi:hypothetical protein
MQDGLSERETHHRAASHRWVSLPLNPFCNSLFKTIVISPSPLRKLGGERRCADV